MGESIVSLSGSEFFNCLGRGSINWYTYVNECMYVVVSFSGKDEPFIK